MLMAIHKNNETSLGLCQASVANSDYGEACSISLATDTSITVSCDPGYSGTGTATCDENAFLTVPTCTSNKT